MSLNRAVLPSPAHPEAPSGTPAVPVTLTLVRDGHPREASAMQCRLDELGRWVEMATSARLGALRAARARSTPSMPVEVIGLAVICEIALPGVPATCGPAARA